MRLTSIIYCLAMFATVSNCKSIDARSDIKDVETLLDVICREPQPLGTYTEDSRYHKIYLMPVEASEVANFCRASPGDCNASSPAKGRAVCEDASTLKEICAANVGDRPVLCYPARTSDE